MGVVLCVARIYMFRSTHPIDPQKIKTGRVRSEAVLSGRNNEHQALKDNRYMRCSKCGFICHMDRDMRSMRSAHIGDGVDLTTNTYTSTDPDGGTQSQADPTVTSGCPLCGSMLYHEA